MSVLFWLFQTYCSAQEGFSWQQIVPRALHGAALAKCWDFLEGLSASGKPLSISLTILHFLRFFRNKINCSFLPLTPNKTWSASDTGMGLWQLNLFYQLVYNWSSTNPMVSETNAAEMLHDYITQAMPLLGAVCPNMRYSAPALSNVLSFSFFI